ncbi:MAG: DUF1302 domain-containing protein [Sinimarinibacterium flocculans]|uniref:Uncharacterized protein DUF1302 n=1 Tax=Sinimarinibacterium flocculans TaxID=985250 RepID=A0A318E7U4_9GAMM|nr:DUF1302 domain-containing protein [Sinimarinibacterium flocculans]PXV67767.1 uncharacterized protein DUF1302 [Sinimarinibacterium flocculans]
MKRTLIALAATALVSAGGTASALSTELAGVDVRLDNKLSLGAAWRVESRSDTLVGRGNGGQAFSTNGDDGNLAFDSGDVVAAAAKITSDLTLSKGNFGVFLRGTYLFDQRLNDYDFFNPDNYYTPTPGAPDVGVGLTPTGRPSEVPISVFNQRTDASRDYLGNNADLLDAYVFGSLELGSRYMAFKIGRQVLNWGESTFVLHGINSLLTFDQNKQRVPGFEIEELLLPTALAWASISVTSGVSVEAFYQLDWDHTEIDAAGSFWSTNDFAGVGGQRANLTFGLPPENFPNTTIPRAPDREPGNSGQFGGRLSMLLPYFNDIDLSLYAMNYHSRLPLISGTSKASFAAPASTGSYFVEYPEDIQLYGISFNTVVGGWSLQGEYSYKVDQPLQLEDVEVLLAGVGLPSQLTGDPDFGAALGGQYLRGYRRHDVSQADIGVTYAFGPSEMMGWDQVLFIGEVGGVYVHDLPPKDELRYEGPGTYTPGDAYVAALVSASTLPALGSAVPQQTEGWADAISWGYKMVARAQYNNVLGRFRVEPTLRFDHDVRGVTPTPITNFVEDRRLISASVAGFYLQSWSLEAGYTRYFGAGRFNLLQDRDFMSLVAKYAF